MAVYFLGVVLLGAVLAPILFWTAQLLARNPSLGFLARFDFETFFHRALLVGAVVLVWPLIRWTEVRGLADLGLRPNRHRWRHVIAGVLAALVPLILCGLALVIVRVYSLRPTVSLTPLAGTVLAAVFVPLIEETFFRGLVLGLLLRTRHEYFATFLSSAIFSILHFLKAPEGTSPVVTWSSGFQSIAHSLAQFSEPMLVVGGFITLFLMGWILADTRLRTASLWLGIGLHAGWILGNGVFSKIARRQLLLLPWLGRNLLVGLIPLAVLGLTWILVRLWLANERSD